MDPFVELASRPFRWLINTVGGTVRYVYGTIIRALHLTKRRSYSYEEYLNGPEKADDKLFDGDAHRFNNGWIGFLFLILFIGVLKNC